MSALEILALALLLTGALFTLLAAIGVVRLADVYGRLSATSKAAPFGIGLILAGAALIARDPNFALQSVAVAIFLTLTSPVAAHALARAARRAGVPTIEGTVHDDEAAGSQDESDDRSPE